MQTLILKHYPPVIKQIKEIQQIAKAEDIEFSKLNISMDEVTKNMFVFTANETGVQRFEKLLGIKPKVGQSLDDRKIYILSMMNRRKMSLSELTALLRNYADVKLIINSSTEGLMVDVGDNLSNVGMIYKILDDFMPLNVFVKFATEVDTTMKFCEMPKVLEMETTTYVRGNIEGAWFLDGTTLLDGSRLLNAVMWRQAVKLELETTIQIEMKESVDIELTARKDLWFLDGTTLLDGSRLLDAQNYEEVLKVAEITTIAAKKKILLARAGVSEVQQIVEMAFGSGGVNADGSVIEPTEQQKDLNNEIYRKKITKYEIVSDTQVKYYCELDEDELAGRKISELALVDAEGDIVTIKNFTPKEKDSDFSFTFKINDAM